MSLGAAVALLLALIDRATLPLPSLSLPNAGLALLLVGAALIVAAFFGEPEERDAPALGVYRWLPEPALIGTPLAALGAALRLHSSFALWVLFPAFCVASILLARDNPRWPSFLRSRWGVFTLALLPSYLVYLLFGVLIGDDPSANFFADFLWPKTPFAISHFVLIWGALWACKRAQLPAMARALWIATGVITLGVIITPLLPLPSAISSDPSGRAAFHVAWAFIGAQAWSSRLFKWRMLLGLWAMLVAVSCVLMGGDIAEILLGLTAYALSEWKPRVELRQLPARRYLGFAVGGAVGAWLLGGVISLWGLAASLVVAALVAWPFVADRIGELIAAGSILIVVARLWEEGVNFPSLLGMILLLASLWLLAEHRRLQALLLLIVAGSLFALRIRAYPEPPLLYWWVGAGAALGAVFAFAVSRREQHNR